MAPSGNQALVNIQKSRASTSGVIRFAVNVAVLSRWLWEWEYEEQAAARKPDVWSAHWRDRLSDPMTGEGRWWEVTSSSDSKAIANQVIDLLEQQALPLIKGRVGSITGQASPSLSSHRTIARPTPRQAPSVDGSSASNGVANSLPMSRARFSSKTKGGATRTYLQMGYSQSGICSMAPSRRAFASSTSGCGSAEGRGLRSGSSTGPQLAVRARGAPARPGFYPRGQGPQWRSVGAGEGVASCHEALRGAFGERPPVFMRLCCTNGGTASSALEWNWTFLRAVCPASGRPLSPTRERNQGDPSLRQRTDLHRGPAG